MSTYWRQIRYTRGVKRPPPPINVDVSREAYDGWHDLAAQAGCTVAALVEAIGRELAAVAESGKPSANLRRALKSARAITAERRRRST